MKFIFSIPIIIASVFLFLLITNPIYKDTQLLKTDVTTYNKALDNSMELQKEKDSLLKKYRSISTKDKNRLMSFLPDSINNIKFILEIEQIANLHGMPLKNIKFKKNNKQDESANKISMGNIVISKNKLDNKPYGVFSVQFTTEGKYSSFLAFLQDLEHNLRLMDIKSISFSIPDLSRNKSNSIDPNIYSYQLTVNTYWLK